MEGSGDGRTHWYEWVAKGVVLSLALGLVVGGWLVFYGPQPWPGFEQALATYPIPAGWSADGPPVRRGCSSLRTGFDPGCDPNGPSEELTIIPGAGSGEPCAALTASASAWAKEGFVPSTDPALPNNYCNVRGTIHGRWVQLSVEPCCSIQIQIFPHPPSHPSASS